MGEMWGNAGDSRQIAGFRPHLAFRHLKGKNSNNSGQPELGGRGYKCSCLHITAADNNQEQPSRAHGAQGLVVP